MNNVVINVNIDVVCVTETWLQGHIPASVVAINGSTRRGVHLCKRVDPFYYSGGS